MTCVFDTFFESLWPLWASTYKGKEYFHHLWRLRRVVATIQRLDGQIWDDLRWSRTICDEFCIISDHLWTNCGDWRRLKAMSRHSGTNSNHFRKLFAKFESIWDVRRKIRAIGDEFVMFAVELWHLGQVLRRLEVQLQSYRNHYRPKYDCAWQFLWWLKKEWRFRVDLQQFALSWGVLVVVWGECGGFGHEKWQLLWAEHLLWGWRQRNWVTTNSKCTNKMIHLNTNVNYNVKIWEKENFIHSCWYMNV